MFYTVAFRIDASRHDACVTPLTWLILPVVTSLSKYKPSHGNTANGSLKTVTVYLMAFMIWVPLVNLERIHACRPDL